MSIVQNTARLIGVIQRVRTGIREVAFLEECSPLGFYLVDLGRPSTVTIFELANNLCIHRIWPCQMNVVSLYTCQKAWEEILVGGL